MKKIDEQLRDAIKGSGLTSYRLWKMTGVKPNVIDRFKTEERSLRLDIAAKLAAALGLSLSEKH